MANPHLISFDFDPRTFVPIDGYVCFSDAPEMRRTGVYLWCIELPSGFLVNYVGKASRPTGIRRRLAEELEYWRSGVDPRSVDVDLFLRGQRRLISPRPAGYMARELEVLGKAYRLFAAHVDTDADCKRIESSLVSRLSANPSCKQFLANYRPDSYRHPPDLQLEIRSRHPIIGLTVDAPDLS
ncbi:MAG: hypothetical protein JNL80_07635 [Phycisphaerae bacterium]|nr:hypothetical protein [Phycisphaerae bacterium]